MCFLLAFPKSLGTSILANWLSTSEFLIFDNSLCNKRCRDIFRVWMRDCSSQFQCVIFNRQIEFPFYSKIIAWALDRCFNLQNLFHRLVIGNKMVPLFNAVNFNTRHKMLESIENVKHLKCCGAVGGLCEIISTCKNLEHLECTNASNEVVLQVAENCPLLKSFIMLRCYEVQTTTMIKLITNCPHLEELKMEGCCCYQTANMLRAIIVHCSKLKVLVVHGEHDAKDRDLLMFALHKRICMHEFTVVKSVKSKTCTNAHTKGLVYRLMAGQGPNVTSTNNITPLHCGRETSVPGVIGEFLKSHGIGEKLLTNKNTATVNQMCKYFDIEPLSTTVSSCDGQYGLELGDEDLTDHD